MAGNESLVADTAGPRQYLSAFADYKNDYPGTKLVCFDQLLEKLELE